VSTQKCNLNLTKSFKCSRIIIAPAKARFVSGEFSPYI